MKDFVAVATQDRTVLVFIPDPASTDGSGKTGLLAANLTVSYTRVETDNDVVITDATSSLNDLANLTAAHNDWGVKEVSSSLAPGLYRLDLADGVFTAGAWYAVVYVEITSSAAAASPMEFVLRDFADEVFDEAIMGTNTLRMLLRGFAAALLGKASGLGTATAVYRNIADTMPVITATVDADGNRTAVTLDLDDTP